MTVSVSEVKSLSLLIWTAERTNKTHSVPSYGCHTDPNIRIYCTVCCHWLLSILSAGLIPQFNQQQKDDTERRGGKATDHNTWSDAYPAKKKKRKTAAVLFGNKQPVILHICTRIHECLVFSQGSTSTSLNVPLPPTHIDPVGPHKGPNDAQPLTTHHIYMQSANTITNVNTCEIRSKHAYP